MAYKFEKLQVWQMALDYVDLAYGISKQLPVHERHNLRNQLERAANSIALNIAEGSTSQSDKEQFRFLGYVIRSVIETVACMHLIKRRGYFQDPTALREAYRFSEQLFARIQAFRNSLSSNELREAQEEYVYDNTTPFD